jgi:hypothetical protein
MRDLPSGTVTFLSTDVEGWTRLLQERAEDYDPIMRHRDMIRTEPSVLGNDSSIADDRVDSGPRLIVRLPSLEEM